MNRDTDMKYIAIVMIIFLVDACKMDASLQELSYADLKLILERIDAKCKQLEKPQSASYRLCINQELNAEENRRTNRRVALDKLDLMFAGWSTGDTTSDSLRNGALLMNGQPIPPPSPQPRAPLACSTQEVFGSLQTTCF